MSISFFNKMESMTLEDRFKEAFRHAFGDESLDITAQRFGYESYQGLDHLLKERRQFKHDVLISISNKTGYSIHWLLKEQGPKLIIDLMAAAGTSVKSIIEEEKRKAVEDYEIRLVKAINRGDLFRRSETKKRKAG